MQVIKQSEVKIAEIVAALKRGKVIVYPTETCYGLGGDATNLKAVKKIFAIKQRAANKSVLVLASSVDMIKKYVEWPPILHDLARKYWPGPLTIVAKVKNPEVPLGIPTLRRDKNINLSPGVIAKDKTIAFRITNNHFASDLVKKLGRPLVSTSANITAQASPYDIPSVLQMFSAASRKPDIIIDNGSLPINRPSTIVRVWDNKMEVLRQGELAVKLP